MTNEAKNYEFSLFIRLVMTNESKNYEFSLFIRLVNERDKLGEELALSRIELDTRYPQVK